MDGMEFAAHTLLFGNRRYYDVRKLTDMCSGAFSSVPEFLQVFGLLHTGVGAVFGNQILEGLALFQAGVDFIDKIIIRTVDEEIFHHSA